MILFWLLLVTLVLILSWVSVVWFNSQDELAEEAVLQILTDSQTTVRAVLAEARNGGMSRGQMRVWMKRIRRETIVLAMASRSAVAHLFALVFGLLYLAVWVEGLGVAGRAGLAGARGVGDAGVVSVGGGLTRQEVGSGALVS